MGYLIITMDRKPNIFEYNDFRVYLRDAFAYRHGLDKKFSKAFVCKSLGLPNSRSYFYEVLNGRFVSPLKIPLFIKVFELAKEEARFFRALVNFNQAGDDSEERELLFEQLIALNRTPQKLISQKEYTFFKEWHHSVVRALLNIVDFKKKDDFAGLARGIFPSLSEKQIRDSINLLLELKLIRENERGFLKPTDKVVTTASYVKDEIIRQYQLKTLEIAGKAVIRQRKLPQRVITKMISISGEGYKRIVKNLEQFNSEVNAIIHKDEKQADRVYQLAMVLFPHVKKEEDK